MNKNYMVTLAHARQDENGKGVNGKAGDNNGLEVRFDDWYNRADGWDYVFRLKDKSLRPKMVKFMEKAIRNNNIGYDMNQRYTLWNILSVNGWDIDKVTTPCETDCSQLVSCALNSLGIKVAKDTYTRNMHDRLVATKAFKVYSKPKYTKNYDKLMPGDIILGEGHTAIVVNVLYHIKRTLKYNKGNLVKGVDVKALQTRLNELGYDCGEADGTFGLNTFNAVSKYQMVEQLEADGIVGRMTAESLGFLYC